jgi:hypothetical protein
MEQVPLIAKLYTLNIKDKNAFARALRKARPPLPPKAVAEKSPNNRHALKKHHLKLCEFFSEIHAASDHANYDEADSAYKKGKGHYSEIIGRIQVLRVSVGGQEYCIEARAVETSAPGGSVESRVAGNPEWLLQSYRKFRRDHTRRVVEAVMVAEQADMGRYRTCADRTRADGIADSKTWGGYEFKYFDLSELMRLYKGLTELLEQRYSPDAFEIVECLDGLSRDEHTDACVRVGDDNIDFYADCDDIHYQRSIMRVCDFFQINPEADETQIRKLPAIYLEAFLAGAFGITKKVYKNRAVLQELELLKKNGEITTEEYWTRRKNILPDVLVAGRNQPDAFV